MFVFAGMLLPNNGGATMWVEEDLGEKTLVASVDDLLIDLPAGLITSLVKSNPEFAAMFNADPQGASFGISMAFPYVNMSDPWIWEIMTYETTQGYCGEARPPQRPLPTTWFKDLLSQEKSWLTEEESFVNHGIALIEWAASDEEWLTEVVETCSNGTNMAAISSSAPRQSVPYETVRIPFATLRRFRDFVFIGDMATNWDMMAAAMGQSLSVEAIQEYGYTASEAFNLNQQTYYDAACAFPSVDSGTGDITDRLRRWLTEGGNFNYSPVVLPDKMSVTFSGVALFTYSSPEWTYHPWVESIAVEDLLTAFGGDDLAIEEYLSNRSFSNQYSWTLNLEASPLVTSHGVIFDTFFRDDWLLLDVECVRSGMGDHPDTAECNIAGIENGYAQIHIPVPVGPNGNTSDIRIILFFDEYSPSNASYGPISIEVSRLWVNVPEAANYCNYSWFPYSTYGEYFYSEHMPTQGLPWNHPCMALCGRPSTDQCNESTWYRSFCGMNEAVRVRARAAWMDNGRIGNKPASICADSIDDMISNLLDREAPISFIYDYWMHTREGKTDCNSPQFPYERPGSYFYEDDMLVNGLPSRHPCVSYCGQPSIGDQCNYPPWYRSFCGINEAARMRARANWMNDGEKGPKPASFCADNIDTPSNMKTTTFLLPDDMLFRCSDGTASRDCDGDFIQDRPVCPGALGSADCSAQKVPFKPFDASYRASPSSYQAILNIDHRRIMFNSQSPLHNTWGTGTIETCAEYAWERYYDYSEYLDYFARQGVDPNLRHVFYHAYAPGGIAAKEGFINQADGTVAPSPLTLGNSEWGPVRSFGNLPLVSGTPPSVGNLPDMRDYIDVTGTQYESFVLPVDQWWRAKETMTWARHKAFADEDPSGTQDVLRYVIDELDEKYLALIEERRSWQNQLAMRLIAEEREKVPEKIWQNVPIFGPGINQTDIYRNFRLVSTRASTQLSCSAGAGPVGLGPKSSYICNTPSGQIVDLNAMANDALSNPLSEIYHLAPADVKSYYRSKIADVERRMLGALTDLASYGCMPNNDVPNVCRWSPNSFVKALSAVPMADMERDFARCQQWMGGHLGQDGKFPTPLNISYNSTVSASIRDSAGKFCPTYLNGTTSNFTSAIECKEAEHRALMAAILKDPRAKSTTMKNGMIVYSLEDDLQGEYGSNESDWGAHFTHHDHWDVPNLFADECEFRGTASAGARLDITAFGKTFELFGVEASAEVDTSGDGQTQKYYLEASAFGFTVDIINAEAMNFDGLMPSTTLKKIGPEHQFFGGQDEYGEDVPLLIYIIPILSIPVKVEAGVAMTLKLDLKPLLGTDNYDNSFGALAACPGKNAVLRVGVQINPHAEAGGYAEASLDIWVAEVGIRGSINVVGVAMPIRVEALVFPDNVADHTRPMLLRVSSSLNVEMLHGKLSAFVKVWLIGRQYVTLFDWSGVKLSIPLGKVEGDTSIRLPLLP